MFPLSEVGKGNANKTFVSLERALNCLKQRGQAAAACWRASRSNAGLYSTRAVESTICLLTFCLLVHIHGACLPAGDTKAWILPCLEGRTCIKLIKLGTWQQRSQKGTDCGSNSLSAPHWYRGTTQHCSLCAAALTCSNMLLWSCRPSSCHG